MQQENLFLSLLDKHVQGTISRSERDTFFKLLASGEYDHLLDQHMLTQAQSEPADGTGIQSPRAAEMMESILNAETTGVIVTPPAPRKTGILTRWLAAACIIGLLILASAPLFKHATQQTGDAAAVTRRNLMSEKENKTASPMKISMEDGSVVTLQPLSKIYFPAHFAANKREVFLEGEAFFDVSKNASRPFFVYYENVVTHVLGTSFNVKTDKVKHLVEVSVVSGKVRVYENKTLTLPGDTIKEGKGVILTPNQKVLYTQAKRQFTASLVNDPAPVLEEPSQPAIQPADFVFKETPLKEVLKLLERTYGIEMLIESSKLNNCLFNGDISQYNMYTKLEIICQSLNATYEIKGTRILLNGPGCD